ncbi:MAG: hypothetical protein ACREPU_14450 [Rhodanobacteraceae bacterium]
MNKARDLTCGGSAWLLWRLPAVLVIAGDAWPRGMAWLWAIAFAMAGTGCLANAARCGRTHCYVTGPLFLLAAIWCLFSALGVVALHPNMLFLVIAPVAVLAYLAEIPLGRYMKAHW